MPTDDFTLKENRCRRCFLTEEHCLCALLPTVRSRTRIVLVRHIKEAFKMSNTARLAALALPNHELWDYGGVPPFDPRVLEAPGTWLLYPEGETTPPPVPPARLVVLDGSWAQARRMTQRLPELRRLPRLSLPPPPRGTDRLRQPPHEDGMSTLEAIARALALLEGEAVAAPLEALHAEHCRRILHLRGLLDPESQTRRADTKRALSG